MQPSERQTNFELCRILAIIMIIGLHYFLFARQDSSSNIANNNTVYIVLESFCIIGVDLFIMISSWFSVNAVSIKLKKIVLLVSLVFVWGLIDWFLSVYVYHQNYSFNSLVKAVIPYFWGGKWFVTAYIIFLCIIPFLCKCIAHLSIRSHIVFVIIMSLLFSIWPTFLPNPPIDDYGYGFMNFLLVFLIISLFKRIGFIPSLRVSIPLFCISFFLTVFSAGHGLRTSWSYNNPIIIVQAYSFFSFFFHMKVPYSKLINYVSSCTFGVFLIHTGAFFSRLVYGSFIKAHFLFISSPTLSLVLNFISCISFFYVFCVLLESIRKFIGRYIIISERVSNFVID